MSLARRIRAALAATGAGALLVAVTALSAPASAASTSTSAVPTDCGVAMHRVDGGVLSTLVVAGGGALQQYTLGTLKVGGVARQPVALAFTGQSAVNPGVHYFHAAFADGTLWRVTQTNGSTALGMTKVATGAAWGQARSMVLADSGQLYVVFGSGTLARYRFGAGGTVAGGAVVAAAPAWKFARSLGWAAGGTFQGAKADSLLVVTGGGNLNQYLVRLDTGKAAGFTLKSGWSAYAHATFGGCDTGTGAPLLGVTTGGNGYLWYDRNAFNLSGADLGPVGQRGTGLTGLLAD